MTRPLSFDGNRRLISARLLVSSPALASAIAAAFGGLAIALMPTPLAHTNTIAANLFLLTVALAGSGLTAMLMNVRYANAVRNLTQKQSQLAAALANNVSHLAHRDETLAALQDGLPISFCTVVEGNVIGDGHSRWSELFTGSGSIAGQPVVERLFGRSDLSDADRDQLDEAIASALGADLLCFEDLESRLVRETNLVDVFGTRRTLCVEWIPIVSSDGLVRRLLVVLQDLSALRALQRETRELRDHLSVLMEVRHLCGEQLHDFVSGARMFITRCRALIESTPARSDPIVFEISLAMSAIEGSARKHGFTPVAEAARRAMHVCDELRRLPRQSWNRAALVASFAVLDAAVARYAAAVGDFDGHMPNNNGEAHTCATAFSVRAADLCTQKAPLL